MQGRQLAELLSANGTAFACLVLDIRDVEEHTRCHIKGGRRSPLGISTGLTVNRGDPAPKLNRSCGTAETLHETFHVDHGLQALLCLPTKLQCHACMPHAMLPQ